MIVAATLVGIILGILPGLGPTTGGALILLEPRHSHPDYHLLLGDLRRRHNRHLDQYPRDASGSGDLHRRLPAGAKGRSWARARSRHHPAPLAASSRLHPGNIGAAARAGVSIRPTEYFALALFGLTMLASIGEGSPIKNLMAGCFGILLATVGHDLMRSLHLWRARAFRRKAVVVGLFALSELLLQSTKLEQVIERIKLKSTQLPTRADYRQIWRTILRSTGIGTFIGVLPAEGGTVASLIGYNEARRWSKQPEQFGQGAIEGIAAEAANNSATGGAMVPTLGHTR